jgi:G8 domain-containing protein
MSRLALRAVLAALCVSSASLGCSGDAVAPLAPVVTPGAVLRWSDPATWPNHALPADGAVVLVPKDVTMLLDTHTASLAGLRVEGTLRFDESDVTLESKWILVSGGLEVGTEASPFQHRATIVLAGEDSTIDPTGVGNKVLAVMGGGHLELHGAKRTTWARLSSTAAKGSAQLTLDRGVDWFAGDTIVVASSDFDPLQAEQLVVQSVSGTTITVGSALRNMHFGVVQSVAGQNVDERAEVGLLTHNVVVRGDSTSASSGYGGHLIVLSGATAHIEGAELTLMGQRGRLARYPVHWHMAADVPGQYARDNAIWHTFNRCLTIHGTHQLMVERNVCYDNVGHALFMEDGIEHGNTVQNNLVMLTRTPATGQAVLASDASAASYWITNPDNAYRNNVAAGSQGHGFWFSMPNNPTGLSTTTSIFPRRTPLREFSGNVAHSNRRNGLHVDDGANPDGTTAVSNYSPRQDPANGSSPVQVASFDGFLAYKQTQRGAWLRGSNLRLTHAILADNGIGATFAANETFVQDALFVGETANKGTSTLLSSTFPIRGYEYYDGRVGAERVTFANYVSNATRPASGLGFNRANGFPVNSANYATSLAFVNANDVYLENPRADKDGDKAAVILDQDGSLTGTVGNYVVANNPILLTTACTGRTEWNAYVCPTRYVGVSITSLGGEHPAPMDITRDDNVLASMVGVPNDTTRVSLNLPVMRSFTFTSRSAKLSKPRITVSRIAAGDWIGLFIPYAPSTFIVYRDGDASHPFTPVTSKSDVDAGAGDRYWRDSSSGNVYIKAVPRTGQTSVSIYLEPR